jgi:hypothetical protein
MPSLVFLQNFKACRDTIMDAVQLYADEKDQALVRPSCPTALFQQECIAVARLLCLPHRCIGSKFMNAFVLPLTLSLLVLSCQIDKMRSQFVTLIETERQVEHHKTALGQLSSTYQADLEKSDFQGCIQEHMQQAQAADR